MHRSRHLLLLVLFLVAACTPSAVRRYYALDYQYTGHRFSEPLPMTVWFQNVDIASTYNRPQIVYRYSAYELQYFANRLWADRPERMLKAAITRGFSDSALFEGFQDRVGERSPSHVLVANVQAIEELVGQGTNYAHLDMTLRLTTYEGNIEVWNYHIDRKRPIPPDSSELMVRAMSELLEQELRLAQINLYQSLGSAFIPDVEDARGLQEQTLKDPSEFGISLQELRQLERAGAHIPKDSSWMDSLQFNMDKTVVPAGNGALFIPALSGDGSREPTVSVERIGVGSELLDEDERFTKGATGVRIPLEPGLYTVYVGSGTLGQRISEKAVVLEGQVSIVEPSWSSLDVQVLDKRFVAVREPYEVFRMDERAYYGTGFGADAESGETTRVWLLRPGLYKLVQPGSNYRARTNFATVRLLEGEPANFSLVIDADTGDYLGAGVQDNSVATDDVTTEGEKSEPWKYSLSLGGDINFTNNRGNVGVLEGTSVNYNLFTDSWLQYSSGSHHWLTRGELEEGRNRQPDGSVAILSNRLYTHTIYTYKWQPWVGPYARIGAESRVLPQYQEVAEGESIPLWDPSEDNVLSAYDEPVYLEADQDLSVRLSKAFSPFSLRQGAGFNFEVVRTVSLELNARAGFGARELVVRGEGYYLLPITEDGELIAFQQAFGDRQIGIEMALLGTLRVGRYVQARSELDALMPKPLSETYYNWRNIVTVRLSSFASLNYRLDITRDTLQNVESPLAITNAVQLQFFYKPL